MRNHTHTLSDITDSDKLNTYSTSEIAIGTWIDGSTIYRKVVQYTLEEDFGEDGKFTYVEIPHGIENLQCMININMIQEPFTFPDEEEGDYTGSYHFSYMCNPSSGSNVNRVSESTSVGFVNDETFSLYAVNISWEAGITFDFILEYTKSSTTNDTTTEETTE